MLVTTRTDLGKPCSYAPGEAFVARAGGRVIGVYVACFCGLTTAVHPEDFQHGPQRIEIAEGRLMQLEPGFTCRRCGKRPAIRSGHLEAC